MTLCADGLQCRTKVSRMLDYATGKGMDVHQLGKEWMYTNWERNGCTPTGKGMDVHQLDMCFTSISQHSLPCSFT